MKKKPKWGPRDVAALRKMVVTAAGQQNAGLVLGVSSMSIGRWLNGDAPRDTAKIRKWLQVHAYYRSSSK